MSISRMWNAAAAVSGFLFVVALAFGIVISLAPYAEIDPTSSSRAIADALIDGQDNLLTGNYVMLMAAFLLIVFSGYLRAAVTPPESRDWPAVVGLGGGLLTAALIAVVALIGISQAQVDSYGADTVVAKTLLTLSWGSVSMTIPGLAAFTGGISLMSLSYETLPRWLGWLGFITTVLVLTFWAFGILLAMLWTATASVILTVREVRAKESPDDDTAES